MHNAILNLRTQYGFEDTDLLKFSTGTKPKNVSRENHAAIKNDLIALARANGCQACCYVTPFAIANGQSHVDRLKFGINTLLLKFDQFLREHGEEAGTVCFDQTTDFKQVKYFSEVFQEGMPFQGKRKKLKYVISIEQTSSGVSHLASVTDVIVGAFRFIMNEPDKDKVGSILLKELVQLMWGQTDINGTKNLRDRGLCIRLLKISHQGHQADIEALRDRLRRYSINSS